MTREPQTRVLLVEDSIKLAAILVTALGLDGFTVDLATTAAEAFDLAAETAYDAIVVDVMLPGMDGLELCRRLRRGGLKAPVVVISARDDLTEDDIWEAGADQFLRKPFTVDELETRLSSRRSAPGWVKRTSAQIHTDCPGPPLANTSRGWLRRRR